MRSILGGNAWIDKRFVTRRGIYPSGLDAGQGDGPRKPAAALASLAPAFAGNEVALRSRRLPLACNPMRWAPVGRRRIPSSSRDSDAPSHVHEVRAFAGWR